MILFEGLCVVQCGPTPSIFMGKMLVGEEWDWVDRCGVIVGRESHQSPGGAAGTIRVITTISRVATRDHCAIPAGYSCHCTSRTAPPPA